MRLAAVLYVPHVIAQRYEAKFEHVRGYYLLPPAAASYLRTINHTLPSGIGFFGSFPPTYRTRSAANDTRTRDTMHIFERCYRWRRRRWRTRTLFAI